MKNETYIPIKGISKFLEEENKKLPWYYRHQSVIAITVVISMVATAIILHHVMRVI